MTMENKVYSISEILSRIKEKYGKEALLDKDKCIGLFADSAPKQSKDRYLLLMFLNCGGSALGKIQNDMQRRDEAQRIVDRMTADYPVAKADAQAVCREYASAFGFGIPGFGPTVSQVKPKENAQVRQIPDVKKLTEQKKITAERKTAEEKPEKENSGKSGFLDSLGCLGGAVLGIGGAILLFWASGWVADLVYPKVAPYFLPNCASYAYDTTLPRLLANIIANLPKNIIRYGTFLIFIWLGIKALDCIDLFSKKK